MKVTVDSVLRIKSADLPRGIYPAIQAEASVPNVYKEKMRREKIGGWQRLPDKIALYGYSDEELILPRGMGHTLKSVLESYGHEVEWIDNRFNLHQDWGWFDDAKAVEVRDYQEKAISAIFRAEQGYWKAPPGAGKTVAVLEAVRRSRSSAIIIVNTTNIAEQWRQRAKQFLGVDVGLIGDGDFDIKPITIAMQQTLHSRGDTLEEEGFFNQWRFVCLDECHHLPAETFTEVLSRFNSKIRIGVSGTPTKQFEWKGLLEATLGPMFHETKKKDLVAGGWLVTPEVHAYHTGFTYDFFSTHEHFGYKQNKKCLEPFCNRPVDKRRHGNNYQEMISDLALNSNRNNLIAQKIAKDVLEGHCVLVLSRRLKHLESLKNYVGYMLDEEFMRDEVELFSLTGKEDTDERMYVAEEADKGSCVIFSTLADEALDIPRIDRIHLAFPARNPDLIRQQIGRAERPHLDKKDVVVYDYVDSVGPLRNQYRERVREVYVEEGYKVNEY